MIQGLNGHKIRLKTEAMVPISKLKSKLSEKITDILDALYNTIKY